MKEITKQYIDYFDVLQQAQERVDSFIELMADDLPDESRDYLGRIRDGLDWSEMSECVGTSIEAHFSQDDLREIISTYHANPVLKKLKFHQKSIEKSCSKIAEKVVERSIQMAPYIIKNDGMVM